MSRTVLPPPYTITIKVAADGTTTTSVTRDAVDLPPQDPDWLSPHFTWTEALWSDTAQACGIDNSPSDDERRIIETCTAPFMEEVRSILGDCPITVTSWYRCDALNQAVGGSSTSEHCAGRAIDFVAPGFGTPYEICIMLAAQATLPFNQAIYESHEGSQWVHLSCAAPGETPKRQCLTIDERGTREGF